MPLFKYNFDSLNKDCEVIIDLSIKINPALQ